MTNPPAEARTGGSDVIFWMGCVGMFLITCVWGTAYLSDFWGYDHVWHEEKVCPIEHRVVWGPGPPYICEKDGARLSMGCHVIRHKSGEIEIAPTCEVGKP